MQISELITRELSSEAEMTRRLLSRIPEDKLRWDPGQGLHTIGWNANHLVETIGWVGGIIAQSEFDLAPPGEKPHAEASFTEIPDLLRAFDQNLQAALAALKGAPDSAFSQPWSLKMGGQLLFTMQKGDCIRKWVLSHSAHHRGILSVYLRLSGVTLPSIYEE
jgi:uncharacterized damage-inducible protein DinB